MIWQRVGSFGMVSDQYAVAKVFLDGGTLYELRYGDELLKTCNDFAECKAVALEHAEGRAGAD